METLARDYYCYAQLTFKTVELVSAYCIWVLALEKKKKTFQMSETTNPKAWELLRFIVS